MPVEGRVCTLRLLQCCNKSSSVSLFLATLFPCSVANHFPRPMALCFCRCAFFGVDFNRFLPLQVLAPPGTRKGRALVSSKYLLLRWQCD